MDILRGQSWNGFNRVRRWGFCVKPVSKVQRKSVATPKILKILTKLKLIYQLINIVFSFILIFTEFSVPHLKTYVKNQSNRARIFFINGILLLSFFEYVYSSYSQYWEAVFPSASSWYWSAFKSTKNFTFTSCIYITERIKGVLIFTGVYESIISCFSFARFLMVFTFPSLAAVKTLSKQFFFNVKSFASFPFLFFILIKLS